MPHPPAPRALARLALAPALLAATVLVGCSGDEEGELEDLATSLGCEDSLSRTGEQVDVEDVELAGTCTYAGEEVSLLVFATADSAAVYTDAQVPEEGVVVQQGQWVVLAPSEEVAEQADAALEGATG